MHFDVIIGNPPYKKTLTSVMSCYHEFILLGKRLKPSKMSMVVPCRWCFSARMLDDFRQEMLTDKRMREFHDYPIAKECFPEVDIGGGINYFLWDARYKGEASIALHFRGKTKWSKRNLKESFSDIYIREPQAISILEKVANKKERTFDSVVSGRNPFRLPTTYKGNPDGNITCYSFGKVLKTSKEEIGNHYNWVDEYKLFLSKAYNGRYRIPMQVFGKPILGKPNSCCTDTYLVVGPFETLKEAQNCYKYMMTKFFRFLVFLRKRTQDNFTSVFSFVPLPDFDKDANFTDDALYAKYNLSPKERKFVEKRIKLPRKSKK